MRTFPRLISRVGQSLALAVLALLVWANWQEPDLHSFAPSVRLVILKVHGLADPRSAVDLQDRVTHLPGVAACTLEPTVQVAVVSYHPEETTEAAIRQALAAGGAYGVSTAPPLPQTAAIGPQCPVPASYVLALERLRFTLNFRRFLVRV